MVCNEYVLVMVPHFNQWASCRTAYSTSSKFPSTWSRLVKKSSNSWTVTVNDGDDDAPAGVGTGTLCKIHFDDFEKVAMV
jgi:hypothetical protein